jgi:hypothetical protein
MRVVQSIPKTHMPGMIIMLRTATAGPQKRGPDSNSLQAVKVDWYHHMLTANYRHLAAHRVILAKCLHTSLQHAILHSLRCLQFECHHAVTWQCQTIVNSTHCTLVTLHVLFEPVRFFELAVFSSLYVYEHHALTYNAGVRLLYWGG